MECVVLRPPECAQLDCCWEETTAELLVLHNNNQQCLLVFRLAASTCSYGSCALAAAVPPV